MQVSQHDSTTHVRAFSAKIRKQMIVTSFHDITVTLLMLIRGNIKGLMQETREFSSGLGFGRLGHRLIVSAIPVPP